jgi:hypothetical protein
MGGNDYQNLQVSSDLACQSCMVNSLGNHVTKCKVLKAAYLPESNILTVADYIDYNSVSWNWKHGKLDDFFYLWTLR